MTSPTTVEINLFEILGEAVAGASVHFRLTGFDTDPDLGTIVPTQHEVQTDANGFATIDLWPNAAGTRGTQYDVAVVVSGETAAKMRTRATVPESAVPVQLRLIISAPPFPSKSDAQVAQEAAQQSAADAAQSANEAQAAAAINQRVPDPTGEPAGQVIQTNGVDGYQLAEAGSSAPVLPEIRRRDAALGFVRTRNIVWDDMAPGVATLTPMAGATLPSGQTWQAFPAQDGSGTVVAEYHPNGLAQVSRSPIDAQVNPISAPFLLVDFPTVYKEVNTQHTCESIGHNWLRWVALNWIDANNFIAVGFGSNSAVLHVVLNGVATNLGRISERTTTLGGAGQRNNLIDARASLYYNVWLGIAGVELIFSRNGRGHLGIPAGFESLIATPGKVGFSAPRLTSLYGFSATDIQSPAEEDLT